MLTVGNCGVAQQAGRWCAIQCSGKGFLAREKRRAQRGKAVAPGQTAIALAPRVGRKIHVAIVLQTPSNQIFHLEKYNYYNN